MEVTLSADYGYVLAVALASTFVNQWHSIVVTGKRVKAGVPYPNCYATQSEAPHGSAKHVFNCAQRAHSNYLENLSIFYTTMAITGTMYPKFAAVSGGVWLFGRVLYTIGYTNPSKEKGSGRYLGAPFFYPAQLALWGGAAYVCYQMIMGA